MHDSNQNASGFLELGLTISAYPWAAKWKEGKAVIHDATGASEDISKTSIQIIPDAYKKPIQSLMSEGRRRFNAVTVPIIDPKAGKPLDKRACTNVGLMKAEKTVGEHSQLYTDWRKAVDRLFNDYENCKLLAEAEMARISVSLPFPSLHDLQYKRKSDGSTVERFRWVLSDPSPILMDVPLGGIFTNLPPEMLKVKEEQFRKSMEQKFAASHAAPFREMAEGLQKVVDRLTAYQGKGKGHSGKFHATLLSNLAEMAEAIPAVNIFGDKNLERVAARLKEVTRWDAEQLRENAGLREVAAKSAKEILSDISDCGF